MSTLPISAKLPVDRTRVGPIAVVSLEMGLATPLWKRGMDLLVCVPFLLVLAPILAFIALIIKLQDGGPVLYRSIRIGKGGKPFEFLKFRTMVPNADEIKARLLDRNVHGNGVTFKLKKDPRVTWFGGFLRRFSLDELPQLWNVVRGEMSLVGPRPAVPSEVARYSDSDRARLQVVPGITCIWQISGRADIPFEKQVEMDREYIQMQGPITDLRILALTLPAVLSGKGAY